MKAIKLEDFETVQAVDEKEAILKDADIKKLEDLPPIAMEKKFKSSPFISPVFGISETKEKFYTKFPIIEQMWILWQLQKTKLIANPGCYTTCSILAIAPLLDAKIGDTKNIIIDAKSGVTGAGRGLNLGSMFCECTESMKAYKVAVAEKYRFFTYGDAMLIL